MAMRCSKESHNQKQGEDYSLCCQALTWVTQRGSGITILGDIQDFIRLCRALSYLNWKLVQL